MLGKKHITEQEDWLKAWDNCTNIYSKDYIDSLTEKSIKRLYDTIDKFNIDTSRMGYGWSGGKDSLVLGDILNKTVFGKDLKGFCVLYPLNFESFKKYCIENKPENTSIYFNTKYDIDFMNNNPEFFFSKTKDIYYKYWSGLWRKQENSFYKENNLDLVIFGRRTIDGNCVRKTDDLPIELTKNKNIYNIIYDWNHEELFAYIRYNNLELNNLYFERNGFNLGNHFWCERRNLGTLKNNLDEVWNIDKDTIIKSAQRGLIVSQNYLKEINYNGHTKD